MSVAIAFVAFGNGTKVSRSAIVRHLEERWPTVPPISVGEKKDGVLSLDVGEAFVAFAFMPAPIPWSDLEGPCKTSWLWPEATEKMRDHSSHAIVTVMAREDQGAVEKQTLLMQATAALIATTNSARGVYWGASQLVISPEMFCDFAHDVLPDELPLHVWIDFRVGKNENGQIVGFTTGMSALEHMEFETLDSSDPPGELRERLYGLANYVLQNGPVINDGDTIGQDADERIRVKYSDSSFGHEGQVMRLMYERLQQKRSWWRRN